MSERLRAANAQLMRLREQRGINISAEKQPSPWVAPLCLLGAEPAPDPSFNIDSQVDPALSHGENSGCAEGIQTLSFDSNEPLVIHPHILINAVKAHQPTGWLAWKLARLADQKGQGWIERDWLQTYLSEHLDVSLAHALRILKQAEGIFFHRASTRERLFYAQPGRVSARLGCVKVAAQPFSMALDLFSSFKEIRLAAYLCALTLWSSAEKPLSRAHIQRLTSISPRTQRAYDRDMDPEMCERYHAFVCLSKTDHCPQDLASKFGCAVRTSPNSNQIRIQLPNCYLSHVGRHGRGRSARARHQFKQAKLSEIPSIRPMATFEQTSRRFYPDALAAFKSAEKKGVNTLSPLASKHHHKQFLAFNIAAYKR